MDNVYSIFLAADYLDIETLKHTCIWYLTESYQYGRIWMIILAGLQITN